MTETLTPIKFHLLVPFRLSERKKLKSTLTDLMKEEGINFASIDYILCSDEYLLKINQDFLQHDDFTDIITFDLSEESQPVIGEIYISVERVIENASTFKVPLQAEIKRVMIHGALHLCGYKDDSPCKKEQMRLQEDYYLEKNSRTKPIVPRGTI